MMCAGLAFADATSVVKAQSEAFNKAFTSCDVPAVLALYQDDATIIWPGQGAVATGKEAIEKVVKASCSGAKPSLKELSSESRAIGRNYIINVGMWDAAGTGPDGRTYQHAYPHQRVAPSVGRQVALRGGSRVSGNDACGECGSEGGETALD
jgi:ketosteroid isomerase-like protein